MDKDILIDVLFTDEPLLGRDAVSLIDMLNDEPVVHISHIVVKKDPEKDGCPESVRLDDKTKLGEDESPAIVYTREVFDNAKVLQSLIELWE